MMRARVLSLQALLLTGLATVAATAPGAEDPGEGAVREAITLLEARLAQAEQKDDKDKIAAAIAALERLAPKPADAGRGKGAADLAKVITPAALRKKLAGRATFNPKAGELTVVYDFLAKDQVKDFDLGGAAPKVQRGVLELAAGESVTHAVEFETLRATAGVAVKTLNQSAPVATTGGVRVWFNRDGLERHLKLGEDAVGEFKGGTGDLKGVIPLDLTVAANRCGVKVGATSLGKEAKLSAGKLVLSGGTGGAAFGKLTLTGTVDPDWARTFFGN